MDGMRTLTLWVGAALATLAGADRLTLSPLAPRAAASPTGEDPEAWRVRLEDPDLDRREEAFEGFLRAARGDRELRDALANWAQGSHGNELAWTARLARRALEARGTPGIDPFARGGPPRAPLGRLPTLEQLFDDLHRDLDRMPWPGGGLEWNPRGGVRVAPGGTGSSESVALSVGPDGARVVVTTEEDGESVETTYEAASLEELLEQHPELRERIGATPFSSGSRAPRGRWNPPELSLERVRTDVLGVIVRTREGADGGLLVERVAPDTIAEAIGLRAGDVVTEVNGVPVSTREDIAAGLAARDASGRVEVRWVDSDGEPRERTWGPAERLRRL